MCLVIGLLFLLGGIAALCVTYMLYQQSRYFKSNVIEVQGRIVDIRIKKRSSSRHAATLHQPVIHYVFQGDVWEHVAEYDVRQYNQKVSSAVKICFRPQRPYLVLSEHDRREKNTLFFISLVLSIPFLGLGIVDVIQNFGQIKNNLYDIKSVFLIALIVAVLVFYIFYNRHIFLFILSIFKNKTMWWLPDNAIRVEN